MKELFIAVMFAGSAVLGLGACGEAAEEVEEVADCAQICEAYGDCVQEITGTEYDELACIQNCENESDMDAEFRRSAASCEECIEQAEDTCLEQSFACADECTSVLLDTTI